MENNFPPKENMPVNENSQEVRKSINPKVIAVLIVVGLTVLISGVYVVYKYSTPKNNIPESPAQTNIQDKKSMDTNQAFVPRDGSLYSELAPLKFRNKVVFLKNGEVWSANAEGGELTQLTNTNQGATYYSVSPGFTYLAFEEYSETQNKIKNDVSVMDLRSGQIVKKETDTGLLSLEEGEWFSDSALYLGRRGPAGDVAPPSSYVLDIQGVSSIDYPPIYGSTDLQSHRLIVYGIDDRNDTTHYYENVQLNGPTIFYFRVGAADDTTSERKYSQEFYVLDTATQENKLVASLETTSNSFIKSASLNHKGDQFAYITSDASNKSFKYGDRGSKVFLHPSKLLFDYISQPSGKYVSGDYVSISDLKWSFDDRLLAFRIGDRTCCVNKNKDQLVIVDVLSPENLRTIDDVNHSDHRWNFYPETRYQWTRGGKVIFERDDGIYIYDPVSDSEKIFSDDSSHPFAFW